MEGKPGEVELQPASGFDGRQLLLQLLSNLLALPHLTTVLVTDWLLKLLLGLDKQIGFFSKGTGKAPLPPAFLISCPSGQ